MGGVWTWTRDMPHVQDQKRGRLGVNWKFWRILLGYQWHLEGFPEFLRRILLQFLNFEIQDLSPLAVASSPLREDLRSWRPVILFCGRDCPIRRPGQKLLSFWVWRVAGGTTERSCYSPHYSNTKRDYER